MLCNGPCRAALTACAALLVIASVVPQTPAANLHDGLVAYWPLSGNAADAAPAGAVADNGEVRNSPSWISGQFNAGVQFDGLTQGILVPASADLDIGTSGVTVSAWVKLDVLPSALATSFGGIYDATADNYVLYLDKGNNELRFKATTAGGVSSGAHAGVPAAMLDTTGWHHVMGTFDGTAGASKIYFDGAFVDISSVNTTNGLVRAGQIAGIGAQPGAAAGNPLESFFPGAIADVAVWNRSLGAAEAQYLYNGGAGNAVGADNPNLTPVALPPVKPLAKPVIRYAFDGDLKNSGTGGAAYDAVLHDATGRNDDLFTTTTKGQGLDLRGNPDEASTVSNGDYLSVDYMLTDAGTIELEFTANNYYDFQTLWSNSVHGNAWESWVYADGRLSARANQGTSNAALDFFLPLLGGLNTPHHIAYTWQRNGTQLNSRLYVDGVLREQTVETWTAPGATLFIGGGVGATGGANDLGRGIYDEFRIYDVALSEAEILFRATHIPEPASLGLMACVAAALGAGGGRLRRRAA
ncbi:MAG: hypothetical protein DCC67_15655 [Planctomycetota bacterium]|nr:MAG: hypothetical protein DCC67_15655 [Planctomycetota bacterium]